MKRCGERQQRTLTKTTEIQGVGFITGAKVTVRLCPAPINTGRRFVRTDLQAKPIQAVADAVSGTQRRTTLGSGANQVTLTEHVLAALAGMKIDNCVIELDGPEPPGLDGSAYRFAEAIAAVGSQSQNAIRECWTVSEPIVVEHHGSTLSFFPNAAGSPTGELRISYLLNYGLGSAIAPQVHSETITPQGFQHELASCRTFVLEAEAYELRKQGIGQHLSASDLLVFGPQGVIENRLHFANEPARHKILDIVGDLALCGFDLAGHVIAYRSGHPLNVQLAQRCCQMVRSAQKATENQTRPESRSKTVAGKAA